MLPNRLYKLTAKFVLTCYLTQLLAPVIYACELETHAERSWGNSLRDPSPPREKALQSSFQQALNLNPHIESLNFTPSHSDFILDEDQAQLQAEAYQYRLKVKTKEDSADEIKIKLSRRAKGTEGSFKKLHTSLIHQGTLASWTSQDNQHTNDVLMNLIKGTSVYKTSHLNDTAGFGWMIPGLATLGVTSEGGVVLEQDKTSTLLSHYDLILKTSQNLSLEYLKVSSLTLDAPTTQIIGSVSVDQLHIPNPSQTIVNEGGLHFKQITGEGILVNHALLKLEGTQEQLASIGIRHFINKKSKDHPILKPIIEASNLRIIRDNQSFMNEETAEFKVSGILIVDPAEETPSTPSKASFINKGIIDLSKEGAIYREVLNYGSWKARQLSALGKSFTNKNDDDLDGSATLTIQDELNALFLINDHNSDITVRNKAKLIKGQNRGTIKGDNLSLKVEEEMTNGGEVSVHQLLGWGTFKNNRELKFQGNDASLSISGFYNQTTRTDRPAQVMGDNLKITAETRTFVNDVNSDVLCKVLRFHGEPSDSISSSADALTGENSRSIQNLGTIKSTDFFTYHLSLKNTGTIDSSTFTVEKGRLHNLPKGIFKGNIDARGSELYNEGDIEADQMLKAHSGTNKGKIYGSALTLDIEEALINNNEIVLKDLKGSGKLINHGKMQFTGVGNTSSQIGICHFENGDNNAEIPNGSLFKTQNVVSPTAKIVGSHIVVAPTNKTFITHKDSEIVTKNLVFSKPENSAVLSTPFVIRGTVDTDVLDIYRQETVNSGSVSAIEFSVYGNGNKFLNAAKATLDVKKSVKANVASFQNDGEIVVEKGQYTQNSGEFINNGLWSHTGDIVLGTTTLKNEKTGALNWQKGTWDFSPTKSYVNHGNWSLDNMTCGRFLNITNYGDFHLKNSTLTFENLINHNLIIFHSGTYSFTKSLINKNLLRFLNHDWELRDGDKNCSHVQMELGDIECEKGWVHNAQVLPKAIRAQGDVTFSKIHQQGRSLADLEKVSANGKVTFYVPVVTTTQNYEFSNIGHLELYVDGLFTTHHSFKARDLILEVSGPLTCGSSNSVMGTLASTGYDLGFMTEWPEDAQPGFGKIYVEQQGKRIKYRLVKPDGRVIDDLLDLTVDYALQQKDLKILRMLILEEIAKRGHINLEYGALTVKAHSIDGQFAQIYGAGPTHIQSTNGSILCGFPIQKGSDFSKRLGCAHEYNYHTGDVWKHTTVNDINGAYISSNSTLDIKANSSLILDYGTIFSRGNATFSALQNISAIRSIIQGAGTARWTAPNILFGRAPVETLYLYLTSWYPNQPSTAAKSDRTEVHFTDSIWFDTQDLTNQAVTIGSGKNLYMLYNGQYVDLSEASKRPPTLKMLNYAGSKGSFHFVPVFEAADKIQINIGDAVITGTMNSPIINIELSGNALFHKGSRPRAYIDLTKPFFFNLTKGIQKKAAGSGLLQLTANNEVQTEFPFGRPYMDGGKRIMFITPENQHLYKIPLDPSRVINPLGSLSEDFLNLHIQSQLSELIGKVEVNGAKGNNLKALMTYGDKFAEETGKALVTREEIERASLARSMLLYGLEQVGNMIHKQMIVCVTPQDINDVEGLSGDSIRIHAGGDLSFQNYEAVAENDLDLFAKGHLSILTVLKRLFGEDGYQDVIDGPTTKIISKKGNIKAVGKNGFQMRGATLRGLYRVVAGSTEGNTTIENVLLEKAVITKEKEDGGLFGDDKVTTTTHITTTSQPSFIESVKTVVEVLCGNKDKTTITGSHIKALQAIKFTGRKVETNASVGVNKFTQHTQQDGMFSSREFISSQEYASLYPTLLEALEIYGNTEHATYRGTDFIADVFYDNTKEGASFGPTIATLKYFQQMVSESPLAKSDVGCEGWYEVMQPCRLMINKIVRNIDEGEIKLESVDWDKDRTQIIGKFAETVYELKRHHREWAEITQVIPNEALVVVALVITIATQGTGGSLFSSAVTHATGGTMVATATGMSMASAAFTTVCTQAATSFLSHGDLARTGKELFSSQGMRSLGTAVATAGLIGDGGSMADLSFGQRLAVNGFRNLVKAGVSSAIEKRNIGDTLKEGGISTLVDSISGSLAKSIGEAAASQTTPLTQFEHKAAHFGIGAAMGAVLDRDHPLTGAVTGGIGAMMAEVIAESLVDRQQIQNEVMQDLGLEKGRPLSRDEKIAYEATYREKLQPAMNTAKLVVASVMASLGHDPSIAIAAASNALENNFAGTPYPELMDPDVAEVLPDATAAVGKSILDIGIDMYENPDPYVEAAVLDATPYGDIAHRYYMGETISGLDLAVESIFVVSGTNYVKAGGKTVLKIGKRLGSQFIKRLEDAKNLRKLERARSLRKTSNVEALDLAGASLTGNKRIDGRLFQEHHIVSNKSTFTRDHKLLELTGFDLESRTNRMFLPTKKGVGVSTTKRSIHDGRHIDLVSERLAKKMNDAIDLGNELRWSQGQYHIKLMKIISEERSALKSGDRILNKNHRPFATDSGRVVPKETIK